MDEGMLSFISARCGQFGFAEEKFGTGMANGDKGLQRIYRVGRGHMHITLWVSLISKYIHQGT